MEPNDKNKTPTPEFTMEEGIVKLTGDVNTALETFKEQDARYEKRALEQSETNDKLAKASDSLGKQVKSLKEFLDVEHGKSGAEDWMQTFGKWFACAAMHAKGKAIPDGLKSATPTIEKAVGDFGSTDALGTYLVPDILMPGIYAATDIYGTLLPMCNQMTVPAGMTVKINARSTDPLAYWRNAAGSAMTEAEFVYAQQTTAPVLLGSYIKVANELFDLPGIGGMFTQNSVEAMARATVVKLETGIVQGDDNALGTDLDPPSDGFLTSTAGATDLTVGVSASTLAAHIAFITAAVDSYAPLFDTSDSVLMMSPAKILGLAAEAVATATGSTLAGVLSWANAVTGLPGQLLGYPYIAHPAMKVSTTHWAAMLKPKTQIVVATSGQMAVNFNPFGSGWTDNETWIRVITHADWAFPMAAHVHIGDYA